MGFSCTRVFTSPPPQVFQAAAISAPQAGFSISYTDRRSGHLYLNQPRPLHRFPRRYSVSITDSGLGSTVVHITWQPTSRLPWPLDQGGRAAGCLCRHIRQTLPTRPPPADS
jgi:hypothetical protein